MSERAEVIFFDLGDTLGSAVLSSPPIHLVAFDVYPFVSQLLSDLQRQGLRLGIISNTGDDGRETVDAVLRAASIVDCFEPGLRLYSHDIGLTKELRTHLHKSRGTCGACRLTATLLVRGGRQLPSAHSRSPQACVRARTLFWSGKCLQARLCGTSVSRRQPRKFARRMICCDHVLSFPCMLQTETGKSSMKSPASAQPASWPTCCSRSIFWAARTRPMARTSICFATTWQSRADLALRMARRAGSSWAMKRRCCCLRPKKACWSRCRRAARQASSISTKRGMAIPSS